MLDVFDLYRVGEIQREYLYYMVIEKLPLGLTKDVSYSSKGGYGTFELDKFNVKAVFPNKRTQNIQLKWGGRTLNISGVDESTKNSTFEFIQDEFGKCYDFLYDCQQLTGSTIKDDGLRSNGLENTRISFRESEQVFSVGIAQVSVSKMWVTDYARLINAKVIDVSKSTLNKEGNNLSRITAELVWEDSIIDRSKRFKPLGWNIARFGVQTASDIAEHIIGVNR